MTIVNDESVFNDASNQSDWTASDFDSPTDNDTNASPSIYREGTVCQQWILKENITDGYTYTSTLGGTKDISNGETVTFWFFITADADLDKLTKMRLRVSSDTGFTTNYAEWDVEDQIYGLDYYGWFPITIYPSNPTATAGTVVYSSIDSIGFVCSTGATGTKLSGFDQSHSLNYIGGHSQIVTLTDLYDNSITNDLGKVLKFSDFFKFQTNIRLGGGTTANTTFNETGKTLFFDNVQPDHNLGFIFVDNTTGQNIIDLDGWNVSWNQQTGTNPEIFTNAAVCDIFRIKGGSFTRGGAFTTRTWISDADTYVDGPTINNCDRVDPKTLLFINATITDTRETAVDSGAMLIASTSHRASACVIAKGTAASHALVFTVPGTYSLSGYNFIDYNAAHGNNDSTIRNESGGAVIINASGITGNLTYQNGTSATTTINNNVNVTFTGMKDNTEVRVYENLTVTDIDISFTASGTVSSAGSGFGEFAVDDVVRITGSNSNDGTYTVLTASASTLTVTPVTIVTESAGETISIKKINQVEIDGIEVATEGSVDARTFGWSAGAGAVVDYVLHNWNATAPFYQTIRVVGYVVPSTDQSIGIQQQVDRNAA